MAYDLYMFNIYCLECSFNAHADALADAGRIADGHSDGPHEAQIYDEANDKMIHRCVAQVAFEESLPEVQ